jgi:pyruvate/2-oxoglutarate dehydrogenase complex dihydrolipoamide dehydrogenase (E3) component
MSTQKTEYDVDLCVIGAGSAGLSMTAGAAMLDRNVILFEGAEMGGDCLNHGCVPSKAILKAGKMAQAQRSGEKFGITPVDPKVDWEAVKAHITDVIATIAPVDSVERFEGLGATVIKEYAKFVDPNTVESETTRVRAKRFVVAVGSRASAPPIPGLDKVDYATNENIFSLDTFPSHLLVIGAGPIGLEMGQTFRRLGADVTIVDIAPPLGRNEPEHAQILVSALSDEGVKFYAPAKTKEVRQNKSGVEIELEDGTLIKGSHLLVAAGRAPAVDGLGLEAAGITYDRRGIDTDDNLRTSNKKVYAAGDVAKGMGGLTHIAGHHASSLFKNFFLLPQGLNAGFSTAKTDRMPAAIYTEPELANIGLTEAQAREKFGDAVQVAEFHFDENDRAIAERSTHGGVKIIVGKKGKILGGSIVGAHAGEMIHMLSVAMTGKMKASQLAQIISPYPTRSEAVKRAASSLFTESLFGPKSKVRTAAKFWAKFQ